jgi:hypothetical protein
METIKQQALRMACDSFLSDYEGTPEPANISAILATSAVWEPFEDYPIDLIKGLIITQAKVNECELGIAYLQWKRAQL